MRNQTKAQLRPLDDERFNQARAAFIASLKDGHLDCDPDPARIRKLRRRLIKAAIVTAEEGAPVDAREKILDELLASPWFDFRAFPLAANMAEMIEDGASFVRDGVLRLPFDHCVFVTAECHLGKPYAHVALVHQGDNSIEFSTVGNLYPDRLPFVSGSWKGKRYAFGDTSEFFYLLLAMSSQATRVVARSIASEADTPPASEEDTYRVVYLARAAAQSVGAGGTHASPRLHWRRGHTRRLGQERISWVRPTLVGAADRGTIVHDYAAG